MNYRYLDPDDTYTDSESGLLRNLQNIKSYELLLAFESLSVTRRLEDLYKRPLKIQASISLLSIHKYLFQDVYSWAGIPRTVEISKEGKQFFPTHRFDTAFAYIDTLIVEYRKTKNLDDISHRLAEILDSVNFLHPFREGNGRTQREFLRTLALEKKIVLNLNPVDNQDVYNRYMYGTINGDVEVLSKLIRDIVNN